MIGCAYGKVSWIKSRVSSALPNVFRSSWMASACHAPVAAQHSPHAVLARRRNQMTPQGQPCGRNDRGSKNQAGSAGYV